MKLTFLGIPSGQSLIAYVYVCITILQILSCTSKEGIESKKTDEFLGCLFETHRRRNSLFCVTNRLIILRTSFLHYMNRIIQKSNLVVFDTFYKQTKQKG